LVHAGQRLAHSPSSSQRILDVEQVRGLEDGPAQGILGHRPDVVHAAQGHGPVGVKQMPSLAGFLEPLLNLNAQGRGLQGQGQFVPA
jgi:hypothetical protein